MGENEDRMQSLDEHVEGGADPDAATNTVATRLTTLPPVKTAADLPDEAEDGTICYVQDEEVSYLFVDGAWSNGSRRGER